MIDFFIHGLHEGPLISFLWGQIDRKVREESAFPLSLHVAVDCLCVSCWWVVLWQQCGLSPIASYSLIMDKGVLKSCINFQQSVNIQCKFGCQLWLICSSSCNLEAPCLLRSLRYYVTNPLRKNHFILIFSNNVRNACWFLHLLKWSATICPLW